MTLFFYTFSQDMSKNMALYLPLLPNQDIAGGLADYPIDCFCSCWSSLKHGLETLLMQERRIKASSCSHGSVDSALLCVFILSLMQLQIALSNIIAKMNISHRDLSQLYSYIKCSILNKIILIMKLWWVNIGI